MLRKPEFILDNIWKSEVDFLLNRNDRLVILSFINTSPYQNDSNTNGNRFDNSVESLDYDLNPFETHESLQSHNTPTEHFQSTLTGSSPIQISTFPEEDEDYDLLETTTTQRTSTVRSTTTTPLIPTTITTTTPMTTTTTQSTSTVPSTVTQIFTEPTTVPTTITTALPTSTTLRATVPTNSPIVTEKAHHSGRSNKSHNKSRKHNHKKHHKQHHELDDVEDVNQEFRIEDFDSFDRDAPKSVPVGGTKKKAKISSKTTAEAVRMTTTKNADSMERPRATQKIFTEPLKPTAARPIRVKESNIHVVKSEVLDLSDPTTTTDDIKTTEMRERLEERRTIKRSVEESFGDSDEVMMMDSALPSIDEDDVIVREDNNDVIKPAALVGSIPNFTQSTELEGIGGLVQSIVGVNDKFDPKQWFQKSPSLEFINLALALLVWSVRYPSVFWESSKAFSMIFSLQMIANSIDILMLHVGTSILFKLQIVGQFMTVQNQPSPLLLNGIVTLALTLLAYVLIISSSMILYLYGHSRLSAKIRDCQMITLKGTVDLPRHLRFNYY